MSNNKLDKIIDRLEEEVELEESGRFGFGFGNSFWLIERGQWERFCRITEKYAGWLLACWAGLPGAICNICAALFVISAAIGGVLMLPLIMLYVLHRYLKEALLVRRIKMHPRYLEVLERHREASDGK